MSVAKGKLFVSTEQLYDLFKLPEGVEILALRPKVTDDGFEFLLVSAEETAMTKKNIPIGQMRRVALATEKFEHTGGVVEAVPFPEVGERRETFVTKTQAQLLFDSVGNLEIKLVETETEKKKEKTVEECFEDVLKVAQRKRRF